MSWTENTPTNIGWRRTKARLFHRFCATLTWSGILVLGVLLYHVAREGFAYIDLDFFTGYPSRHPEKAGIKSALLGTVWLIGLTGLISVPLGLAAAIYLEEYAGKSRINTIIEINISNLAGVPSIVYGILGLAVFVRFMGFGRSVLAGAATLSLLILPVIIMASREAIRAVPQSLRQAAFAVGATRWQTIRHHVLPTALPGVLTGIILSLSRAIGETAPLVMIGALTLVPFVPKGPLDAFTALPIQVFNWASRPQEDFHDLAAAAIIVLLGVLFLMNAGAIILRHRTGKRLSR